MSIRDAAGWATLAALVGAAGCGPLGDTQDAGAGGATDLATGGGTGGAMDARSEDPPTRDAQTLADAVTLADFQHLADRDLPPGDGAVVATDGAVVATDGAVVATDGAVVATDGAVVATDGAVVTPDAAVFTPDAALPDAALPDAALPDAFVLTPDALPPCQDTDQDGVCNVDDACPWGPMRACRGELDSAFGSAGLASLDAVIGEFTGLIALPGGAVVAVGAAPGGGGEVPLVARFTVAGALDVDFAAGAGYLADAGALGQGRALAVSTAGFGGAYYVTGRAGDLPFLVRSLADGRADPVFNGGAALRFEERLHGGAYGVVTGLTDEAYLAIDAVDAMGHRRGFTARVLPAGQVDPAFGGGPIAAPWADAEHRARAVAVGADGTLALAGDAERGTADAATLSRFDLDGLEVSTTAFSAPGNGGADHVLAVATRRLGYLAVGERQRPDGRRDLTVSRLDLAGALDPTFGEGGVRLLEAPGSGPDARDAARAVVVLGDDSALIAGSVRQGGHDLAVVLKLRPDGTPDPLFGDAGWVFFNLDPAGDTVATGLALHGDDAVVVSGYTGTPGARRPIVLRVMQ